MYTSAVAAVRKTNHYSLKLEPLSKGQKVHHLFYVSGVVAFKDRLPFLPDSESAKNVPSEILLSPLRHQEKTHLEQPLSPGERVLIDFSDISFLESIDLEILKGCEEIFVCLDKTINGTHLDFLESVKSKVSLLILENHNLAPDNLFRMMPDWLRHRAYFVYLPKQSPRDCLLSPAEVVERLEARALQCSEHSLDLNIASFGAGSLADLNLINFYNSPSAESHIKIVERENYFRYLLIKILRASGLAGVLGFIFWFLKIVLNPSDYNIGTELTGWVYRAIGWLHGLFVDSLMIIKRLYGFVISVSVRTFWFIKRNISQSWQIRLFLKGLWGNRWKAHVYLQRKIGQLWRVKVFILALPGQAWRIRVFLIRMWSQRWRVPIAIQSFFGQWWRIRVFVLRLIGHTWRIRAYVFRLLGESWRIRAYVFRLLGESWRIRIFFQRQYWIIRSVILRILGESWRVRELMIRIYWSFRRVPIFYLLWPFKKIYWFTKYQFETRILSKTKKELGNE